MYRISDTIVLMVLVLIAGCGRSKAPEKPASSPSPEVLMETNRYLAEKDDERIRSYIRRHGWEMQRTGSGLWYEIYEHGNGEKVQEGKKVVLDYSVSLLDGSQCYSSEDSGPKQFVVGHGQVESGLDEAVRLLRVGDRAHLILPPWLAWGVPGDRNKIPPRSVIVYDVKVLDVN